MSMSLILRIIGGGLIALVCAYVGVLVKRRYKTREKFFKDACDYFSFFEKELTFKKTPLPEINKAFAKTRDGDFALLVANSAEKPRLSFLKPDEKQSVDSALAGLGKSVYDEQVAFVKRWQAEFKEKADKCASENKKYGGMYFKLCVLLGIALLILIA